MKILNIKQKNKRTTNCIVSIIDEQNNAAEIELSMDIVLREKLATPSRSMRGDLNPQQTIDNLRWERIVSAQRIIEAKQSAYKYATKVNKTQKQVEKFLETRSFSDTEINEAIAFLQNFGLVDDNAFARKYINDTLLTKNIGPQALLTKLIAKGIDKQTATQAVEEHYPADGAPAMLENIVHKKLRSISGKHKTKEKIKASVFNHVLAKGFSFDDAKKACQLIEIED